MSYFSSVPIVVRRLYTWVAQVMQVYVSHSCW